MCECVLYVSKLHWYTASEHYNLIGAKFILYAEHHFNFYYFKSHANTIHIWKVTLFLVLQFDFMFDHDIFQMQRKKQRAPIKRCATFKTKFHVLFGKVLFLFINQIECMHPRRWFFHQILLKFLIINKKTKSIRFNYRWKFNFVLFDVLA